MDERLKNTLGIKKMKIVESVGYFDQYIGKPMVFWVSNSPIYYSIDSLTEVKIVPLESCVAVVFLAQATILSLQLTWIMVLDSGRNGLKTIFG